MGRISNFIQTKPLFLENISSDFEINSSSWQVVFALK